MMLRPVKTIKEWLEMISTATLWEAIGCVVGIAMTAIFYVLLAIFWIVLLVGVALII